MSFEEEMARALSAFVVEGRELLEQMETGLLGLETDDDGDETVNAVFRAVHTIKGSAGLFGLDHIVRFTHVVESVLDRVRNHEVDVTPDLVGALLPCSDHLAVLIGGIADGRVDEDPETAETAAAILADLQPFLTAGEATGADGADDADDAEADAAPSAVVRDAAGPRRLHLSLRFGSDCLRNGMDPLAFIRYLSTVGEVVSVATLPDRLPEAAAFDPETCYLDFEVTLQTEASVAEVENVFEFVREDSDITVLEPGSPASAYPDLIERSGVLGPRIREVLVATGAASEAVLDGASAPIAVATAPAPQEAVARIPAQTRGPAAKASGSDGSGSSGVSTGSGGGATQPTSSGSGAAKASGGGASAHALSQESRSIRIDATRLDRLIDAVGELVIAGASAELSASHNRDEALLLALGEVMRLVEEVRDSALQLRMVPIGTTFSRFQRVVRDVSASLGKDIGLVISGGDTEVDKALVEQIGDPLMHLVRNAMDHGIESAEVRAERGKPARGTVRLNAFHDSGSIVIEVSDDGGGIPVDRVLAKAIERGLVEPGAALSDSEVAALIFEPGFSTAAAVSDLSGRGVGMDVVKRNVTALLGTIDIDNKPGDGCTVRIRLPLTLAIIDGFMVAVGGATYVIPLDWVVECVELPADADRRDCMDLRGEVLPFIRLRSLFAVRGERPRRENVVVVEYAGMKVGLVVDTLLGEFQTVIKPLGQLFEHVRGIGGATILGNGEVALIVDVPMLIRRYGDKQDQGQLAG